MYLNKLYNIYTIFYTLILNEIKSKSHVFSKKDQSSGYNIDTIVNAGILSKTWLGLFQIRYIEHLVI